MQEIIIAAISTGLPTIATIVTAKIQAKTVSKNAAKQSILQMILEDHVAVGEGRLPTNYQNILHDFDIYTKAGGNSYLKRKVEEYEEWLNAIEKNGKTSQALRAATKQALGEESEASDAGRNRTE